MPQVEDFQDTVSGEVYRFLKALKQHSIYLIELEVWRKDYGYFVFILGQNKGYLYELELRLYETGVNKEITYVMIQFFQVSPVGCGNGSELFQMLLECLNVIRHLIMIRLEANDEVGEKFWIHQNKFRLKGRAVEWIKGDTAWCDIDCLNKPAELNVYRYIYDVRRCECESCRTYYT